MVVDAPRVVVDRPRRHDQQHQPGQYQFQAGPAAGAREEQAGPPPLPPLGAGRWAATSRPCGRCPPCARRGIGGTTCGSEGSNTRTPSSARCAPRLCPLAQRLVSLLRPSRPPLCQCRQILVQSAAAGPPPTMRSHCHCSAYRHGLLLRPIPPSSSLRHRRRRSRHRHHSHLRHLPSHSPAVSRRWWCQRMPHELPPLAYAPNSRSNWL